LAAVFRGKHDARGDRLARGARRTLQRARLHVTSHGRSDAEKRCQQFRAACADEPRQSDDFAGSDCETQRVARICRRAQLVHRKHSGARHVRGALIEARHVAADHQPNHVFALVLLAWQLARALAVAEHDDSIGQPFDFGQPMRNVHDADASSLQVYHDLE
jgi:hypothetical protein